MLASIKADPTAIAFQTCTVGPKPLGTVHSVSLDPCERGSDDEPCRFRSHRYVFCLHEPFDEQG